MFKDDIDNDIDWTDSLVGTGVIGGGLGFSLITIGLKVYDIFSGFGKEKREGWNYTKKDEEN